MEALARLAVRRPVAITVLVAAVMMVGWAAFRRLPLDLLPDISSPTVLVSIRSGDRPPTEMERLYGEQVEQRLFVVRGIRSVTQVARTGRLVARVTFEWDANMDLALVDVQKAVGRIAADPDVDEVLVRRFDPRQLPVLALGLIAPSGQPDLAELRRIARRQVAPALEQLEGVAEVRVTGGRDLEVQVQLDRERMESFGVTVAQLEAQLQAANLDVNAGTLEEGNRVVLVRGLSRFRKPEDVAAAVIRYRPGQAGTLVPVRVGDVANVVMAEAEIRSLVRVDGREGVGIEVFKEAGANTVAVSRTVREALGRLSTDLPGVEVRVASDEAALIQAAVREVEGAALIGVLLAVAVLAVFLRAVGPTVVVAAAVPVSLLVTTLGMYLAGQSLNLMTLGGLALGAGMLVDNAIVVVESVFRRRAAGEELTDAVVSGTAVVAGAIVSSTLTTCVVFLPVLFVRGLSARLVSGLSFTVVVSLLASLVAAVVLIPALAGWLLPKGVVRAIEPGRSAVERMVARLLRRPWTVLGASAAVVVLSVWGISRLGTELLPPADPRQLVLRLVGPPGQRVEATDRMVATVEEILRQAAGKDLEAVLAEVGQLPDDDRVIREEASEENTAVLRVRLAEKGASARVVADRAAPAVAGLAGVEASWDVGASALARALGTTGPPIVVELDGRSLEDLRHGADEVAARLRTEPGLWNVRTSFEGGPPELRVVLDRTVADGLGVDLDTVAGALETALDGRKATVLTLGDEELNVVLRWPPSDTPPLAAVPLTTAAGVRLVVGDVAKLEPAEGAREILRRDQRRIAQVTARIASGASYPKARAAVAAALGTAELRPGVTARLAGEEEERARTFGELRWAAVLALVLVLMVLAGTFESLLHPITVLAAVPLALIGVAVVLVPIGQPIGVMAVLGLIVLAGVAVNDAILLVSAAQDLQAEGMAGAEAVARAAAIRLRPILMTTLTTVLALVPLALGGGEGAQLRGPLAWTIIGGLTASTIASLTVIPCLFLVLDRLRGRTAARHEPVLH